MMNGVLIIGYNGFCEWVEHNINPRDFIITLNCARPIDEVLVSLAHEMVHVGQFTSNRLKHRIRPMYRYIWEGNDVDINEIGYDDLPWEIEAYHQEYFLYSLFKKSLG